MENDNEEQFKVKEKKANSLIIIIAITLALVVGWFLNIAYNKYIKEEPKQEDNEVKETINEEEIASHLVDSIRNELIIDYYSIDINNFEEFDNQELLQMYFHGYYENKDNQEDIIDAKDVENYFKNYYNIQITHENVDCYLDTDVEEGQTSWHYRYDNGEYIYDIENHPGHGGGSSYSNPSQYTHFNDIEIKDDLYIITTNKVYFEFKYDTWGPDYELFDNNRYNRESIKTLDLTTYENGNEVDYEQLEKDFNEMYINFIDNIEEYEDQMTKYIYTFKKIEENYILTSYEVK